MRTLTGLLTQEEGATAMEYAFIASLISIVILASVTVAGGNLIGIFNNVAAGLGR